MYLLMKAINDVRFDPPRRPMAAPPVKMNPASVDNGRWIRAFNDVC